MIALLQRVTGAAVDVNEQQIAEIGPGLLVLLGVEKNDGDEQAGRLIDKVLKYRVFTDKEGKMNLSLLDIGGELLLVPQFTLAASTQKGLRPSFSSAAAPAQATRLFEKTCELAEKQLKSVEKGQFGANMKVSLVNDGPVTFWIQV